MCKFNISKIIKEVITDPGIGFAAATVFLYASATNKLGFYSCIFALLISIIIKILSLTLTKDSNSSLIIKLIFDQRFTLWVASIVLIIVAFGALATGNYLAAITSFIFAIADTSIAESISGRNEIKKSYSDFKKIFILLFKRPDLYINFGTILACLMAGNEALLVIPLIAISFILSILNIWHKREESYRHPKLFISSASLISLIIAIYNLNYLIAISHLLLALIYINIESRITKGGIKGIISDIFKNRTENSL